MSRRLDRWKPEEVEAFTSKGGNQKVNERLKSGALRGVSRAHMDAFIRRK